MTRKKGVYYAFFAVFFVSCWFALFVIIQELTNSIANIPDLKLTKSTLQNGIVESGLFYESWKALRGGALHPELNQGYHELVIDRPMSPRSIASDFTLRDRAYVTVTFGRSDPFLLKNAGHHFGVRLSVHPDRPSAFLKIKDDRQFLAFHPMDVKLETGVVNHLRIDLDGERAAIHLNGDQIFTEQEDASFLGPQYLAVQGNAFPSVIDNICVTEESGPEYRVTFSNRRYVANALFSAAGVLIALGLVTGILSVFRVKEGDTRGYLLAFLITASVALAIVYARLPVFTQLLDNAGLNAFYKSQSEWHSHYIDYMRGNLENEFSRALGPDKERIFFMGTSQTAGHGTTRPSESFFSILRRRMKTVPGTAKELEFVNMSIGGGNSGLLLDTYEQLVSGFEHQYLLINLGVNDSIYRPASFRKNITAIVERAQAMNVLPILCIEAVSAEQSPEGPALENVMKEIAGQFDVPFINMFRESQQSQDTGVFWWDYVHPTSYGFRVLADILESKLTGIMASRNR